MQDEIVITRERADQPEVAVLLDALDRYLAGLYAPEDNYILGIQALLAPEVTFMGARRGADWVGCGAVRRLPAEEATGGAPYGEIKRMFVVPQARGLRVGARLLAALEDSLRSEGITWALLETGRDQVEAVRLYERAGYVRRGPFGGYPDNGLSLFMAKALA
jgi:putative acetyltransferase